MHTSGTISGSAVIIVAVKNTVTANVCTSPVKGHTQIAMVLNVFCTISPILKGIQQTTVILYCVAQLAFNYIQSPFSAPFIHIRKNIYDKLLSQPPSDSHSDCWTDGKNVSLKCIFKSNIHVYLISWTCINGFWLKACRWQKFHELWVCMPRPEQHTKFKFKNI